MNTHAALRTLGLLAFVFTATSADASTWKVDQAHTTVGFSVSHLFTRVQGRFDQFEGSMEFDPANPSAMAIQGSIVAASIDTNNEKRDKHLRSSDFFDVEKYPKLSFESAAMKDFSGNRGKLEGQLTIHGVTKQVVIDVVFHGHGADPWGNVRAGFSAKVTIDRKDYGLNWNEVLETGGFLVGDQIEIQIELEAMLVE